jgi:hypothetical protein
MRIESGFGRRALFWGAPAAACLVASTALAGPQAEGSNVVVVRREAPVAPAPAQPKKGPDFLFFEAETGAQWVGLETLSVKRDVVPTAARTQDVGAFVGAGAGLKLVFLSVGPHFRVGHFQDWDLWTLDLDLGFHAPLGAFEPFLRLGGGYARLERAFDRLQESRNLHAHGYHLALALGADYFVTPMLTLGGKLSGDMLALQRAGVDLNSQDGLVNDYLKYDGAAAGLGLTGALTLGLHF